MRRWFACLAAFGPILCGCSHHTANLVLKHGPVHEWAAKQPAPDLAHDEQAKEFASVSNALAFKLFTAIDAPGDNVLISPVSVSMSLSMLANGARGDTQRKILKLLNDSGGVKPLNEDACAMMVALHRAPDSPICLSNGFWTVGPPRDVDATFSSDLAKFYFGKIDHLSQGGVAGAQVVNQWINESTSGLIQKLEDSLNPDVDCVFVNTAAFECPWQTKFDPKDTREQPFHNGISEPSAQMMSLRRRDFLFYSDDNGQGALLPYQASDYGMVVYVPERGTPEDFLKKQTWESWGEFLGAFGDNRIDVSVPRMTFERLYDTRAAFTKLGLGALYDHADMSGISPSMAGDALSKTLHKTFLNVGEEGTQAAAATEDDTAGGGASVIANRPFAFAIVHRPTNAILFLGVCNDPTKAARW